MLAVTGAKGGVGRTTCALALGVLFARGGHDPLVVDCDPAMPDLARLAGCRLADTRHGLDRLGERPLADLCHTPPDHPGVTLLPTGLASGPNLTRALARLDWPGPVVLDCPAGVGEPSAAPLRAADRSLLVTTATERARSATERAARIARSLDAAPVGAVVTHADDGAGDASRFGVATVTHVPRSSPAIDAYISSIELRNYCLVG